MTHDSRLREQAVESIGHVYWAVAALSLYSAVYVVMLLRQIGVLPPTVPWLYGLSASSWVWGVVVEQALYYWRGGREGFPGYAVFVGGLYGVPVLIAFGLPMEVWRVWLSFILFSAIVLSVIWRLVARPRGSGRTGEVGPPSPTGTDNGGYG